TAQRDERQAELARRAADLEGQQAMLAALRGRLERMREDVRRESQLLTEQRTRQDATEQETQQRLEEARQLRDGLEAERQLYERERQQFEVRHTALQAEAARLAPLQESMAANETRLREGLAEVEARDAAQSEQVAWLEARATQLAELQQRLEA